MRARIFFILTILFSALCFAGSLDPAKFAEVQKQNAAALHNYTWKQRTELQLKGETKKVTLNLMRYDADGSLQKTLLSDDSPQQAPPDSGGRLKQKVVAKKTEEFKETIEGLAALVQSYAHIPQDKLKAAMARAEKLPPAAGMEASMGLRLPNVLQPKDSLTVWADPQTLLFQEVDIATFYKDKPVTVNAKYAKIDQGPNYMSDVVMQYPDQNIQVSIDNFEYTPSNSASAPQKTPQAAVSTSMAPAATWPRVIQDARGKLIVYQPQLDEWQNHTKLKGRSAVAFAPAGKDNPYLGIITVQADTEVDHDSHLVKLSNLQITASNFPGLTPDQNAKMLTELRKLVPPNGLKSVSLDLVIASLDRAGVKNVDVMNDPPKIYFSKTPAILVIFDGKPVMSPIKDSDLQYAVNTNWDFFYSTTGKTYYLRDDASWLQNQNLTGPWDSVDQLPNSFTKLPAQDNWKDVKANIPGKEIEQLPIVLVSQEPAELILLEGEPNLQPIPETSLVWVSNTKSDLIFNPADNHYYYLVSGRWFRTTNLEKGPWSFATPVLPADFKNIPTVHPMGVVRASVPGTREAEEAVIQASIPQTAKINKKDVKAPAVTYSGGKPEFKPIEKTSLQYAVNTADDVIEAKGKYYLCYQGVWYVSGTPQGPWAVADTIPAEIYSIPTSSPVYHTTYVTVVEDDPADDWVTVAVAAGYFGTVIASNCVVWGTGYYYPPYVWYGGAYPIYHPYYYSYGAAAYYNPYTGTFGRGAVAYGPYGGVGYGAAYNPRTGTYARGAAAYGPYGGAGYAEAYNPRTGIYARGGAAYGPYGAGAAAQAYNPRTGTYAATRQGTNYNSSWGTTAVGRGDNWAQTAHYSGQNAGAMGYTTSNGNSGAVGYKGDDLYAGHDGNVYKKTDDGWNKYQNGSWNQVQKPQTPTQMPSSFQGANRDNLSQLNHDNFSRAEGAQRSAGFQSFQGRARGGGGGFRRR